MSDWFLAEIYPPPILQNMTNADLSIQVAQNTLVIPGPGCIKMLEGGFS